MGFPTKTPILSVHYAFLLRLFGRPPPLLPGGSPRRSTRWLGGWVLNILVRFQVPDWAGFVSCRVKWSKLSISKKNKKKKNSPHLPYEKRRKAQIILMYLYNNNTILYILANKILDFRKGGTGVRSWKRSTKTHGW